MNYIENEEKTRIKRGKRQKSERKINRRPEFD